MLDCPPKFGLRLAAVRIQGFRSLFDVSLTCSEGATVLIGANNTGKTSFLLALGVAFGQRRPAIEDLFEGISGKEKCFQVDLRIEPSGAEEFSDTVRDIIGDGIQLGIGDEKQYFSLRTTGEIGGEGWDITLQRKFLKGWPTSRKQAEEVDELSSPTVGRHALELLNFDMLDARRDIQEQLRNRRTYWGRMTSNVSIEPSKREKLEKELENLGRQMTNESSVLKQVSQDLSDLSSSLPSDGMEVELEVLPRNIDDLVRSLDISITSEGSARFPVAEQGMGTRSLAALLAFRSYVNVVRPRQDAENLLSLAAFEEPEAHLHPHAQRSVFDLLARIGGQRIVSTHSAYVASIAELGAYRIFRREAAETNVSEIAHAQLEQWDTAHVRRYVQIENPEVLFAKSVGIVEGQTETDAFPVLARNYWPDGADQAGVSIVSTDGAGSGKHLVPFLDAMKIPWVIFCDGDVAGKKGLASISSLIGRTLDDQSSEVVQLPSGHAIEEYIVNDANLLLSVKEIIEQEESQGFDGYKVRLNGQKKTGNILRDYDSKGGDERAAVDFLSENKGTVGRLLAERILQKVQNEDMAMPERFDMFFKRLKECAGELT